MCEIITDIGEFLISKEFWASLVSGGLTVLAGWWAFKATTNANLTSRKIEAQKLYAEWIAASNAVRDYAVAKYRMFLDIQKPLPVLNNQTIRDVLSQSSVSSPDCWMIFQVLKGSVLDDELSYAAMYPHLTILGRDSMRLFNGYAEAFLEIGRDFDAHIDRININAPPAGPIAIALEQALKDIFLSQGRVRECAVDIAQSKTGEIVNYFRQKTEEYQERYEKLAQHFIAM